MTKQKNVFKKFSLLILVCLMVLSNTLVVNANINNNSEITPYYVNIADRSVKLSISGIKASCSATIQSINLCILK